MTKQEKKRLASAVTERLKAVYPNAECALEYGGDPWKLLVMGRLSAQCTDKRVNIVSKELFERFPTAEAMANGDISEIVWIEDDGEKHIIFTRDDLKTISTAEYDELEKRYDD